MHKLSTILFLLLIVISSCKQPSELDTPQDITIIYNPNDIPAVFRVEPEIIDFGIVHPGKTYNKDFLIRNISSKAVNLNTISAQNFTDNYLFSAQLPHILSPKNTSGESLNVTCSFTAGTPGNYSDKMNWSDYKNPETKIIANVASVWAEDYEFDDKHVGELSLGLLELHNSSNTKATVTQFEILDSEGVIINEPKVHVPFVIEPNSVSNDIYLTFNPGAVKQYKIEIKIKVEYSDGAEHFTDETINLDGRGIF